MDISRHNEFLRWKLNAKAECSRALSGVILSSE